MSRTIQAYIDKHPEKFEEWHSEAHNERGLDYWVWCREPYFDPDYGMRGIHEDTVKDTLRAMRRVIKGRSNGHEWVPL